MQKNTTRPFTYLPSVHPTPYQYALIVRSNGASMRLSSCCYWYSCCNYCVCIVCSKLLINEVCLTRTNMIVQCYGRLYFLQVIGSRCRVRLEFLFSFQSTLHYTLHIQIRQVLPVVRTLIQ